MATATSLLFGLGFGRRRCGNLRFLHPFLPLDAERRDVGALLPRDDYGLRRIVADKQDIGLVLIGDGELLTPARQDQREPSHAGDEKHLEMDHGLSLN